MVRIDVTQSVFTSLADPKRHFHSYVSSVLTFFPGLETVIKHSSILTVLGPYIFSPVLTQ